MTIKSVAVLSADVSSVLNPAVLAVTDRKSEDIMRVPNEQSTNVRFISRKTPPTAPVAINAAVRTSTILVCNVSGLA